MTFSLTPLSCMWMMSLGVNGEEAAPFAEDVVDDHVVAESDLTIVTTSDVVAASRPCDVPSWPRSMPGDGPVRTVPSGSPIAAPVNAPTAVPIEASAECIVLPVAGAGACQSAGNATQCRPVVRIIGRPTGGTSQERNNPKTDHQRLHAIHRSGSASDTKLIVRRRTSRPAARKSGGCSQVP